jgi:hypothetical protein
MQSNPASPGGSLTSKPTWSNACGCSATSAVFVLVGRRGLDERPFHSKVQRHVNHKAHPMILYYGRTSAYAVPAELARWNP